jgi:hypothetical protein
MVFFVILDFFILNDVGKGRLKLEKKYYLIIFLVFRPIKMCLVVKNRFTRVGCVFHFLDKTTWTLIF